MVLYNNINDSENNFLSRIGTWDFPFTSQMHYHLSLWGRADDFEPQV